MKKLQNILIVLLFFSTYSFVYSQKRNIDYFINDVITSYSEKNSIKFNSLINKDLGIHFITTIGANNNWISTKEVCFANKNEKCSIGFPYQDFLEKDTIIKSDLIYLEYTNKTYFECEKIEKKGIFVSSKGKYHTLSESIFFFIKNYKYSR
ncbi:hypothetical protein [Chryseobacterium luquanense]|uniref:Uncharacterized protein n=1 Tax=Chryseobacterium luquanense TaxID=2983766 RepID=A0ABT3Y4W1_9FLAO|nr:hypothetical protein [Chryseobacterium luquanense]MCX8533190.1 hypothetical protein [Chryseobacterium luquanense]